MWVSRVKFNPVPLTSGLPPSTDIARPACQVRKVPTNGHVLFDHLIDMVARPSSRDRPQDASDIQDCRKNQKRQQQYKQN